MKKRIELKRVRKLIRKGYIPVTTGTELLYVVKGNKSYVPKVEMEVL